MKHIGPPAAESTLGLPRPERSLGARLTLSLPERPALMRHETAAMTMRYAHSTSERRRAAVGKVLA